jgi:hypothetical protein
MWRECPPLQLLGFSVIFWIWIITVSCGYPGWGLPLPLPLPFPLDATVGIVVNRRIAERVMAKTIFRQCPNIALVMLRGKLYRGNNPLLVLDESANDRW